MGRTKQKSTDYSQKETKERGENYYFEGKNQLKNLN